MKARIAPHGYRFGKSRTISFTILLSCILFVFTFVGAEAQDAKLPFVSPLFSDNMVLQRNEHDPIWGWTTPGAMVTVTFRGRKYEATASGDGKWMVKLPPMKAGGPFEMTIVGPDNSEAHFRNILIGDVWLCSGQSNMQFGVENLLNPDEVISKANYPNIRLFFVPYHLTLTPSHICGGTWEICTPDNLRKDGNWGGFSAVAYFFGRDLYRNLHVPIGLIHSSVGGTPAESWTSEQQLKTQMTDFDSQLARLDVAMKLHDEPILQSIERNSNYPTVLYNGMINPLIPFEIKGVIWYQGENNAGKAYQYRTLLPAMISDWRDRWGYDFPFLIVQLAGFIGPPKKPGDDAWAELREAQWLTTQDLPDTWIATAFDIGNPTDIHPKDKQDVGKRLALVAEKHVYGEDVTCYGPVYQSMKVRGDKAIITFTHTDGGLMAKGGVVKGFAIAGADKQWAWANAKITSDDTVEVSSPEVPKPVAVRYGWASYLVVTLYNKDGLPAFPFRTDDWPEITRHNK
jgi:sialate O-acetylesterase